MEEKSQLEIFSYNLRRILADKELSQNQLAKKMSCSVPSVNAWCQGQSMPRVKMLEKLCLVLNVSRSDLLQDRTVAQNLSVPAAYPVPMHGLRHTYASMLIKDGVPVSEVSAQLGHASVDITLRVYTHLFTEASTASKAISDAINAKWAPEGHQKPKKKALHVVNARLRMVRMKGLEPNQTVYTDEHEETEEY